MSTIPTNAADERGTAGPYAKVSNRSLTGGGKGRLELLGLFGLNVDELNERSVVTRGRKDEETIVPVTGLEDC
jgi:hypothetical protein